MAQTKHTFVESKMNKDLDDRLLSGGQYRDALNVAVSKSEDSDVGALENVLGNNLISSLFPSNDSIPPNLQVIGGHVSNEKNSIYLFITNYCDNSVNNLDNPATSGSTCLVVEYNVSTNSSNFLIQGNFLNFSTTHPVLGVNIIEDLLFWTDNRNQPRKINIETAKKYFISTPYYTNEDQISVAKYAPVFPPNILDINKIENAIWYKNYNWNPWSNNPSGSFATINATLVFYDNTTGSPGNLPFPGISKLKKYDKFALKGSNKIYNIAEVNYDPNNYSNEGLVIYPRLSGESLTVATDIEIFTQTAIDATSEYLPSTVRISIKRNSTSAITLTANSPINVSSSGNTIVQWESPRVPWQIMGSDTITTGCGVFSSLIDETKTDSSGNRLNGIKFTPNSTSTIAPAQITLQQDITIAGGDEAFLDLSLPNPNYKPQFAGDKENLKDKFVRFAYRFKYDDNEYSLTSPFTQPVFVPNQDGYLLNTSQSFNSGLDDRVINQQDEAGTQTVLSWFENKINQIGLNIPMEYSVNEMFTNLKVIELQILYKQSDEGRLKVVDDIDFTLNNPIIVNDSTKAFTYQYQSGKPFKTLPPDVITRTSDKVPIKALAQESAGNRIMYGNFIDQHTSPLTLEYLVSTGEKLGANDSGTVDSFVQYPNHTLKQNRTYQVGVILQDRYGRQTDVILAEPLAGNRQEIPAGSGNFYGDSTVYHSYKSNSFSGSQSMIEWPGDSLKVLFTNKIPSILNNRPGYPGLYDATTNPLGFYSYKIVVKQKQQEYYNVYLPSLLYGVPIGGSVSISWNSENSQEQVIQCNEITEPSNTVFIGGTSLTGLETTTGLQPGMKFVLKSNSFTNDISNADCCPPNNTNNPCPNACGVVGGAQCTTYTITGIPDDSTISFSPQAVGKYSPFCQHTPGSVCCDKTPGTGATPADNCGTATGSTPNQGVRNSQPTPELVFTQDGTTVILNPKTVNSPSEMTTTLLTDNINKMPADLNDVRPNQEQFSTSDDVYFARVGMNQADKFVIVGGINNTPLTGTSLVYSSQVNTGVKSDVVKILASYRDLFPTTAKPSNLYKTSTNPFTSIMSNTFQIGSVTDEPQTFTSFETEPVISELDIFWETSSSGIIDELNNVVIGLDPGGGGTSVDVIGIGGVNDFSQNEDLEFDDTSPVPINVGIVNALNTIGDIVSSDITLISVRDGNGVNLDSFYDVIADPSGGNDYILRATDGCVFLENAFSNQRIFTFKVVDTQVVSPTLPTNNLTNFYSYTTSITNAIPIFVGFAEDTNGGNGGWPNNPVAIINLTDYSVNQYSTVGAFSVIGTFQPDSQPAGGGGGGSSTIPKSDSRIYFKNGSGAQFFSRGVSDNEFSEVTIEMQVSRTDSSNAGEVFTAIQPQLAPANGFITTSSGTTIANGVIQNYSSVQTTGVGANGQFLGVLNTAQIATGNSTNSGGIANQNKNSLSSVGTTGNGGVFSGRPITTASTTSTSTGPTIEVFDGFYLTQAGDSSDLYTPDIYDIPDNVPAFIVGWYGGYYISENPAIRDNAGQLATNTSTGQPYIENGGAAAAQDFDLNWLKQRYIRFIIRDANGTALALSSTIGTNVIGQDGIRIDFNVVGTPTVAAIRSFALNYDGNGVINPTSCGDSARTAGFFGIGGNGANSTDEGAATGNNQTAPSASVPPNGNNPYNLTSQSAGQNGALAVLVNNNN